MDAWTPIKLSMIQKNLLNFGCKPGIFSTVLGSLSVFPGIIATLGNLQRFAEEGDRVLLPLFCDELKFHTWPREKMPIASDNISLFRGNSCIRNVLLVGRCKCQHFLLSAFLTY